MGLTRLRTLLRRSQDLAGEKPHGSGRAGTLLGLLLLATLALSSNALLRGERLVRSASEAEVEIPEEIEIRARTIRADLEALLATMAAPLEASVARLRGFVGNRAQAFELLDAVDQQTGFLEQGRGLSLYGADGAPRAWAGTSYPAPEGLLEGIEQEAIVFRAGSDMHLTRIYAVLKVEDLALVAEATVESGLDPHVRDSVVPALEGDETADLRIQDFRADVPGFADYLARGGDLHPGRTTGERRFFFIGLRAPGGDFLGHVRLRGVDRSDLVERLAAAHADIAAGILVVLLAGLGTTYCFPSARRGSSPGTVPWTRLAAGLALIWGGRVVLSWFPLHLEIGGTNLFDLSLFASAGFYNLLRSPGDLALTAAAVLITMVLLLRSCGRVAHTLSRSGRGAWAACVTGMVLLLGLAILLATVSSDVASHLVRNSAVDPLAVTPLMPSLPTVLVQASVLLVLLALALLALGGVSLVGCVAGTQRLTRIVPLPGDGLARWTLKALLPGMLFASLAYDPLFVPAARHVIESIFEQTLMPWVKGQREARDHTLRATLDALEQMPDLVDRILTAEDRTGATLALDLWLHTPLATSGYDASLVVFDAEGNIISRFSRDLPPALDTRDPGRTNALPGEPITEDVPFLGLTKHVLHGDHQLFDDGHHAGTVTVHILDEMDNVPFLTPETPYSRALAHRARRIAGLPPTTRGVQYVAYDSKGDTVPLTRREAPMLPEQWTELLVNPGAVVWAERHVEGRPARFLFFGSEDHIFALGFPASTVMERAARSIRMTFLGLELLCLFLVPAALVQTRGRLRGAWSRMLSTLGRTHYRKLLTTFTAATLVPLLVFAALMSGYIKAEVEKDIEDRGTQGLRSAGSLMRILLEDLAEGEDVDDDTMYWLSLQVGEDVNFYRDGDLIATSRRDLFRSGLLSQRMDGDTYRALDLEGRRMVMGQGTLGGYEYRTINSPVISRRGARGGHLSLPLDAQASQALLRAREVGDVLLITSLLMVMLTGAVGYLLARKVSRPIRSLSAAAARIAAGDLDAEVELNPRDETGELIRAFNTMARSIKEQQADLERRRDYIEKILLNATIGVISMERGGKVVTTNPAASAVLGLQGLTVGADLAELLSARADLSPLARALESAGESTTDDLELSLGGEASGRTVRARVVPFLDHHGLILLIEDVTETMRSNRLAAWADMARRIAHEIKNPLTPIQLSAEHIRRVHSEGSADFSRVLEECLMTIMKEVANLRAISSEFSTYARIPAPRKESTMMSELIRETVRPYRTALPPEIRLEEEIEPDLPALEVDRSLINRSLINLVENALQAMPKGGALSLRGRRDGDKLIIEVADTGVGMDAASVTRIFEPYFSTKDTGVGLGLAIARRAIEEHGGTLEAASGAGHGTTMRITLPLAPAARNAPAPEPAPVGSNERETD